MKELVNKSFINDYGLIAEFLGSKYTSDACLMYPNGHYYSPEGSECMLAIGEPEDWNFIDSWDWLMVVIEKIEFECGYDVNISYNRDYNNRFRCDILNNKNIIITYQSNDSKIRCVYNAVIEFIKAWNQK